MPIYEYVCMSCESHFEELVGISDPDPRCPDCGHERVAKQLSAFVSHGTAGQPSFKALRRRAAEHEIEKIGEKLRAMMPWIAENRLVDRSRN